MKQSNLTTPRTLDDACFISGHNAVRRYRGVTRLYDFAVVLTVASALVIGLLAYFDVLVK
jgi:hypothetical protein